MKSTISNTLAFSIYVWIRFFLFVFLLLLLLFQVIKTPSLEHYRHSYQFLTFIAILNLTLLLFDYIFSPTYFEAVVFNGKIIFKYFNPNKRNALMFFLMLFYKKFSIEQIIERQAYNNYKIKIDRFGFRKNLIFQKIDKGQIYESTPINISFLHAKKYTDLVLSIDRLQEKITLN